VIRRHLRIPTPFAPLALLENLNRHGALEERSQASVSILYVRSTTTRSNTQPPRASNLPGPGVLGQAPHTVEVEVPRVEVLICQMQVPGPFRLRRGANKKSTSIPGHN
jgi:hypothetical protein